MDNPLYQATIPMGGADTSYNAPKVLGLRIHADQSFDLQYTLTKGDGTTPYDIDGATSQIFVTAYKGSGYTPVLLVSGVHSDSGHGGGFDDVATFTVPAEAIPEDIANFPLRNPGNAVFYAIITDSAGKLIEIVAEVNIFDTDYSLTGEAAPSNQVIIPKGNDLGTVESLTVTTPPTPTLNIAYIVGASATGDWAGQDNDLAIGTGTAWIFFTPTTGNFVYDKATDGQYAFDVTWAPVGGAPFSDASAIIKNDSDNTKLLGFDLSAIATATERTWTVPNSDLDLTPGTGSYGDVSGPGSAVNENIAVFDSTTGKIIKDGLINKSAITANTAKPTESDISGTVREYTKQQNFGTATLSDGANIGWDLDDEQVAKVTLGGDRTLDNPTNMVDGGTYILRVIQDGTGTRLLSYGTAYKFPGGTDPVLTTASGSIDYLTFISDGTSMFGVFSGDFS